MQVKKQKSFSHSVTVLLISINFLLFILLLLVCYIAVESKRVFSKKLSNLDKKVEKNLGNLSHLSDVKERLVDLSQVGKKINVEFVKEKIADLTISINKFRKNLVKLGKEFVQGLKELKSDLSSLNSSASNLQQIKDNLKNLKEINLRLKGLSDLGDIKNNLNNLESIKNDISKIKMPGSSKELEAVKEKLASLEKEGQALVEKFSEGVDSIICSKCHRQTIGSSFFISEPKLTVKKEDWVKWVKEKELTLKYKEKCPPVPGGFPGAPDNFYGPSKDLRIEETLLTQIKNGNKNDYKIILKDNSYLCPNCKRKTEKLEGIENYEDDLPQFIKDFLN